MGEPLTYPVSHFITDSKEHQHIVTFCDAHCIEVTENISTCYPALGREQRYEKHSQEFSICRNKDGAYEAVPSRTRDFPGRAAPKTRLSAEPSFNCPATHSHQRIHIPPHTNFQSSD